MKNKIIGKRILCTVLSILMLVSMMPMASFAAIGSLTQGALTVEYDDVSIQSVTVAEPTTGTYVLTVVPQDGYQVTNISAFSWTAGILGGGVDSVELLPYEDLGNNQYQIVSANTVEVSINGTPDPTKDEIEVRYVVDGDLYAYDIITKGETPAVPAVAPTKEGYAFIGWKAASSGTVYTGTPAAITAEETYTAEFEVAEYTLTYYRGTEADASDYKCVLTLDGGTIVELYNNDGTDHPTYDVANVAYGSTVVLGEASLPGYTFAGWKDASGYIHPAGAAYVVKADTTLTATWTEANDKIDCMVQYVSEGKVVESFLAYDGQTITVIAGPTVAGKVFAHWECNGATYLAGNEVDIVAGAERSMVFTAVYTDELYDVTYTGDNDTVADGKDLPYGTYVLADAPTKDGYIFVAWEDAATGAYYDAKTAITLDADKTFVAVWAAESTGTNIVKFYAEDGSIYDIEIVASGSTITAPEYKAGKKGNVYQWVDETNKTYADAGDTITVEKDLVYKIKLVSEATYDIVTYVTPNSLSSAVTTPSGKFAEGEQVMLNITVPDGYILKSITAVGGDGGSSVAASIPVVDSLQHIVANFYNYYLIMPAARAVVTIEFEEIPVGSTVAKFMTDGSLYDYVIVTKGTNGTAPATAPVKEGYTFVEWKNGTTVVAPGAPFAVDATAADEIVFEAVWSQDQYLVNYDTLGGLPSPTASNQYYGDVIKLADAPALDGNEFIGWVEASTGFVYAAGASYTVKGDVNFTAKWEVIPPNEYTVRFVDKDTNQIFGYEIVKDGDTLVAPVGPSFDGKTFSHWEDEHGAMVMAGATTPAITTDTIYYAQYDVNTHGVTSVTDQCVVTPSSLSNVAVGTLVEFEVTANDKYAVENVSISYNDGMSVVVKELTADASGKYGFYMPDADVTISAIAAQNVYSIFKNPETYAHITSGDTAEVGQAVVFTVDSTDANYVISNVYVETVGAEVYPVAVSTVVTGGTVNYVFQMPSADVRITAQTEQTELTVTFLDADNTLLGIIGVGSGDLVTAPVAAKDGYTFDGWEILPGGAEFDPATDYVVEDLVVRATYVGDAHTLTAGLIDNIEALSAKCTISTGNTNSSDLLQTALDAETGKTVYFTVAAEFGYDIIDIAVVSAAGTNLVVEPVLREMETVDNIVYYTYSFTMPAEDVELDIYTVPQMFKVNVSENIAEGGDYTINGYFTSNLMIAQGDKVTVTATPALGYTVTDIVGTYIDNLGNVANITGVFDAAAGTFTFDMIAKDVDVAITYEANIYNIDIQTSNFASYKPDASYNPAIVVESLDDELTSKGLIELVGGSTENYTNSQGAIYVIPANGAEIIGTQVAFTVTEYTGYDLAGLSVTYDGGTRSCAITEKNGVYYFVVPADDVVINATFAEETYKVTKGAGSEAHGKITINSLKENTVAADYKDIVTVTVTPDAGYQITNIYYVLADGSVMDFDSAVYTPGFVLEDALDVDQSISFHMPASDVEVFAEYTKINYSISAVYTPAEVEVNFTSPKTVGDQVTFDTTVKHGYFIDKVYVINDTTGQRIDAFTATTSEAEIYGASYKFEMPASSVTIHVVTVKDEYAVKYYDAGGLVGYEDIKYKAPANVDEFIQEVVNAKAGYHFIGWYSADVETPVDIAAPSIDKNDFIVIQKATIRAAYAKDEIDVVFGATTNGTVTCNGNNAAYTLDTTVFGDTVEFTAVPDEGYVVDTVSVTTTDGDGYNLDVRFTENNGKYTFVIPATYKADVHAVQAEDVVVQVTFKKDTFTLSKGDCDAEGTIAVNGEVSKETVYNYLYQDEVTITATPDNGYYVSAITANKADGTVFAQITGTAPAVDTAAGNALTLSFNMPAEDLTYTVAYEKIHYSIDVATTNAANAAYGTVEKSVDTAVLDELVTLTVTEKEGYDLVALTVTAKDGVTTIDLSELVKNNNIVTTTFEMPAQAVVVTAVYETEKYQVIKGADSEKNGKIESTDADGVTHLEQTYLYDYADQVALKITAEDGWYVASVKATAKTTGTVLSEINGTDTVVDITFTMPAEDVEITVVYAEIVYNIATVYDAAQGTVVTAPALTATVDDLVNITVTPEYGYVIDNVFVATVSGEHIALSKDSDGKYHFTMPAEDVKVTATFVKDVYTVTFKDYNGDILEIDYVDYLDAATAPADPAREGYTFIGWDVDFSSVTTDLVVTAQYEIITSSVVPHAISFTGAVRGTVTVPGGDTAKYGDVVSVVCDPDDGYRFESISVKTADGEYIAAAFVSTDAEHVTTYSFVMPDCDIEIFVSFAKYASSRFTDVRTDFWFFDAVNFVTDRGYFVGMSDTLFAPHMKMNRAMFVTVLARMNGVDLTAYTGSDFADVKTSAYYAPAVKWASENGIVKGYSDVKFGPKDPVTREQMCAIMYRYCDYAGYDIAIQNTQFMDRYTDIDQISSYAVESVEWAVGVGLIRGMSKTTINPKNYATRAQVAQIIKNLSDKVIYQ